MLALRLNAIHVRYSARWYDVAKALSVQSNVASHCTQSTRQYSDRQKESSALAESKPDTGGEISTETLTVGEATKTVFNTGIIICGLGITATLLGFTVYELFSSNSFNNIYHQAVDRCKENPKVQDILGQPVIAYGDISNQRRKSYVSQEFQRNGENYALLQFYLKGTRRRGTVFVELKKDQSGKYQTEVMALLTEFSKTPIVIEDCRALGTPSTLSKSVMGTMDL